MGLMPPKSGHNAVFATSRSLENLPAPRGLTIHDQNMSEDEAALSYPEKSNAVWLANFTFVELTLAEKVLVTLPYLLQGVASLYSSLAGIGALVVKLPQYISGSRRPGLGCHMGELFTHFGQIGFPLRLDVFPEDQYRHHYSLRGHHYKPVKRRVLGSGR